MRKLAWVVCFFIFGCAVLKDAPISVCVCKADEDAKLFAAKLKQNLESIVLVITKDFDGRAIGAGTGWVYGKNGVIITARHVINELIVASVEVTFYEEGRTVVKKALWRHSANHDLSVLTISHKFKNQLQIRTTDLESGENLYALGFPLNFMPESGKKYPQTQSYGRFYMYAPLIFRIDLALVTEIMQLSTVFASPGFSGAPVFDKNGSVVGVLSGVKSLDNRPSDPVFAWSTPLKYFSEVVKESKK